MDNFRSAPQLQQGDNRDMTFLDYWVESTSEDRLEEEEFGCYQARHISDLHSNIPTYLFITFVSISIFIMETVFIQKNFFNEVTLKIWVLVMRRI